VIKTVSYDAEKRTLVIELTQGSIVKYSPAPYEIYLAIVNSRFPEKVYRHQVMDIIPTITGM
jgi:hypothetical protein